MARILVVGHASEEGRGLVRLIRKDGHRADLAKSESGALRALSAQRPQLMVLALPDPSNLMQRLGRSLGSEIRSIPAIAVVHQDQCDAVDRDVPGLMDVLPTPFSEESFLAHIDALLRVRQVLYDRGDLRRSESGEASTDTPNAPPRRLARRLLDFLNEPRRSPLRRRNRPLEPYLETAASIVGTVEGRDGLDPGHAMRVSEHCASMAAFLGLTERETELLLYASSVHDIGKIAFSPELLRKPTLTETDRKIVKLHPRRSAELIRALTHNDEAADVVLYHHERPDGRGYYGRSKNDVPLLARVLSVADVFDGMTSSRSGRSPLTPEEAVEALRAGRGTSYDAPCVDALASAVRPRRTSLPVSPAQPPIEH